MGDVVDSIAEDDASPEERMKMLIEQNVLLQLQHLRTHPAVAAALAKGETELHGWVYDIKSGEVKPGTKPTASSSRSMRAMRRRSGNWRPNMNGGHGNRKKKRVKRTKEK